jgi:hypothetical protein
MVPNLAGAMSCGGDVWTLGPDFFFCDLDFLPSEIYVHAGSLKP